LTYHTDAFSISVALATEAKTRKSSTFTKVALSGDRGRVENKESPEAKGSGYRLTQQKDWQDWSRVESRA